jgi:hypothetical protein
MMTMLFIFKLLFWTVFACYAISALIDFTFWLSEK